MKYVVSLIFSFIKEKVIIDNELIEKIKKIISHSVAEVESVIPIELDINSFYLCSIKKIKNEEIEVFIPETGQKVSLFYRSDAQINKHYVIKKKNSEYQWAALCDFYSQKEGIFPSIKVSKNELLGAWRKQLIEKDYIIIVDNKSIGHRPDLWGHKGIARELACFLNFTLIKENALYGSVKRYSLKKDQHYCIKENDDVFFGVVSQEINFKERESSLKNAVYLAYNDIRPRSFLVDLSNMVLLQEGHPLHVFDGDKIEYPLVFSKNNTNDSLLLLDNTTINLKNDAIIVEDRRKKPLSLAGIMGGAEESIKLNTQTIIIEAGAFNEYTIRKTAAFYNKRTESSTRFEKGLSPQGAINSVMRFLFLIKKKSLLYYSNNLPEEREIKVNTQIIKRMIGEEIDISLVLKSLKKLGFLIKKNSSKEYCFRIPWWRSDVLCEEDIAGEIARMKFLDDSKGKGDINSYKLFTGDFYTEFIIKKNITLLFGAHEVITYSIAHEKNKKDLAYDDSSFAVRLKNGYSIDQHSLVTNLIPSLMGLIKKKISQLRGLKEYCLFEIGSVFNFVNNKYNENKQCTVILYCSKDNYNFYQLKNKILYFFKSISIDTVKIKNLLNRIDFLSNIAGELFCEEKIFGYAGFLEPNRVQKYLEKEGSVFVLTFDIESVLLWANKNYLLNYKSFNEESIYCDVSFFIKKTEKIALVVSLIKDKFIENIIDIFCIDFLEREEWGDKRSVTLRVTLKENENLDKSFFYNEIAMVLNNKGFLVR